MGVEFIDNRAKVKSSVEMRVSPGCMKPAGR